MPVQKQAGCESTAFMDTFLQVILHGFKMTFPEATLRTSVDALIIQVMEHVIKHQSQAARSVEIWKIQSATCLTDRLDRLLQHHRPRVGVLEEDWCKSRRSRLSGLDRQLAHFLQNQASDIASQVSPESILDALNSRRAIFLGVYCFLCTQHRHQR